MITLKSGRKIGQGEKPYIIAEIGSNWTTYDEAKDSITQAKLAGADAVKFQLLNAKSLSGFSLHDGSKIQMNSGKGRNGLSSFTMYDEGEEMTGAMPQDWLQQLAEKARIVGIDFMCTAFSPELYDVVNPYVEMHKVASAELTHIRILQKLNKLKKPVVLSTGASGEADIEKALTYLKDVPVILLYCVASYPALACDPKTISVMRERFKLDVGFSDHSTDYLAIPREAAQQGAVVLEKHMTIIPQKKTPDSTHSLTVDQFKIMVSAINGTHTPRIGYTVEEGDMIAWHNRRLIAIRDIEPGDKLIEGKNFGIYRSLKHDTQALSPFAIDRVAGKEARIPVKAGDGIGPKVVDTKL